MNSTSLELSIIISNYNNKKLLGQTLKSIKKYTKDITTEIIVVDDGSNDGSSQFVTRYFPNICLIRHKHNLGYSKSYNSGTKQAKGRYILHLNSDVVFIDSSLLSLIHFMDKNTNVGIAGGKIIKMNGDLDLPCKRSFPTLSNIFVQSIGLHKIFPKSKFFGKYYLTYLDDKYEADVECLMGAFMLIRWGVINDIGLLDEQFFIYGEDIDYCYRAKKAGWKIYYYPKVIVRHHHGGTTKQFKMKHIWRFHYAMLQYYIKHFNHHNKYIKTVVYLGIIVRFSLTLTFEFFKRLLSR